MNITKESSELMRFFFKDFEKQVSNKNPTTQKKTDSILTSLYEKLRIANKYVENLNLSNQIKTYIKKGKLPNSDLLSSNFVSDKCKKHTLKKDVNYLKINSLIYDKKITIYFTLFENNISINHYKKHIKNILILLYLLLSYSADHKSGSIVLYLYLTPEKKILPNTSISILNQENVNTAVTTACNKHGSVLVYRKEEWFKVLIHELHHLLCLDFSGLEYKSLKKSLLEIFKIKSDYNVAESYSEFWATIINCLFCSFNTLDDNCDKSTFLLHCEFFIEFERIFSLFQTIKVLDFMGMNYKELISNNTEDIQLRYTLYREKTNVFCYYILKNILLFNYDEFLSFCHNNNTLLMKFKKTPLNFKAFFNFILKRYKSTELIKSLTKKSIYSMFYKIKNGIKFPYKEKIINTMRMTISEFK